MHCVSFASGSLPICKDGHIVSLKSPINHAFIVGIKYLLSCHLVSEHIIKIINQIFLQKF